MANKIGLLYFIWCSVCMVFVVDGEQTVNVETGKKSTLTPEIIGPPQSILWKFSGDKVVEFEQDAEDWYKFQGQALLNNKTGQLTLLTLDKTSSGLYECEIQVNGKLNHFRYWIAVFDRVPRPKVRCCSNNTGTEEVTLCCFLDPPVHANITWSGPDNFQHNGDTINVKKNGKAYFCSAENEVSKNLTEFNLEHCFQASSSTGGIIGGIIAALLLVGGFGGFIFWKKKNHEPDHQQKDAVPEKENLKSTTQETAHDQTLDVLMKGMRVGLLIG